MSDLVVSLRGIGAEPSLLKNNYNNHFLYVNIETEIEFKTMLVDIPGAAATAFDGLRFLARLGSLLLLLQEQLDLHFRQRLALRGASRTPLSRDDVGGNGNLVPADGDARRAHLRLLLPALIVSDSTLLRLKALALVLSLFSFLVGCAALGSSGRLLGFFFLLFFFFDPLLLLSFLSIRNKGNFRRKM